VLYAYALLSDEDEAAADAATWPLYVFSALGLLIKGPIAVILPVLAIGTFTALTRRYARLRRLRPGAGALVALIIAGSWYAIAAIRAPDYLWSFLWRQNVDRFLEGAQGSGHSEPFWFYFWVLPLTFMPWTPFLPGAAYRSIQRARRGHDLDTFLLVWTAVVFVFFTLARAKLATYLLPLFPPLALIVAGYLHEALASPVAIQRRAFAIPTIVWATSLSGLAIAITIGVAVGYPPFGWQAALALVVLVFPLAAMMLVRRGQWQAIPAVILVATLASQVLFYRVGSPIVNEFMSLHAAAEIARALPDDARVLAFRTRGHSFTFYGGHQLTRARSPEAAAAALEGEAPVGLLTKTKYLDRIQAHLTEPVCVWWQGISGRVLLANRPFPDASRHAALMPGSEKVSDPITTESPHC
jgi:4-amino-4-deoxy-L-arabinose transferase-like glycosyltransferase